MQTNNQNTALLLFTRTPQEELSCKNLLGKFQQKKQRHFYYMLVQQARHLGQQTGLPFFVIDSTAQQGESFGQRLQQAFASVFARGYTKVIAIGNDCTQLKHTDILEAACQFQNQQAVFGPTHDGGVYLLGLDQELLEKQPGFIQINWQTNSVLSELQTWCAGSHFSVLPRIYSDLDTAPDLRSAFNQQQLPAFILKFLAVLFSNLSFTVNRFIFLILQLFKSAYSFRGPPAF